MNKKLGFILGGVGLAGVAYGFYIKKQAEKLKSLQYRFQNIQFKNIGLTNVKIQAEIVVNNPSSVKFTIRKYDINILFKGQKIVNAKADNLNTVLYPNGVATLPIEVQLDPLSVGENLLSVLLSNIAVGQQQQVKNEGNFKFAGTMSGRFGLIGFKNIPIDYTL